MRPAALALALALLAGCAASERTAPVQEAGSRPGAGGGELLAYALQLRGLGDAALASEAARQRRDASDVARVKAAMALSYSAQADEGEILALVEPIAKREAAPADARAMASFLQVLALERRRLRESAAAAGTRLRDERRAAETQKQRADALQERAAQLQQKLDALTELEKSLSDRPPPGR